MTDRFDLSRFVAAQHGVFETALSELQRGRKESHWMWFIFPQLTGLGRSATAQRYAISSAAEARAYLAHDVLGPRLLDCCRALLSVQGKSAAEIFGSPDDVKLRSSMTLFARVATAHTEFDEILQKFFGGVPDPLTLALLRTG